MTHSCKKSIVSMLLATALLLASLPTSAFATDAAAAESSTTETIIAEKTTETTDTAAGEPTDASYEESTDTPSEETAAMTPPDSSIAENPDSISITCSGEFLPSSCLTLGTQPHKDGLTFAVTLNGGEPVLLEGNLYTVPELEAGCHTLLITAEADDLCICIRELSCTIAPLEPPAQPDTPSGETTPAAIPTGDVPCIEPPSSEEPTEEEPEGVTETAADPSPEATPEPPAENQALTLALPQTVSGPGLYFGQLHAHTDLSEGDGTVEEAFLHASQVEGLDFLAVTDHSDSFDNGISASIDMDAASVSQDWARGKAAAAAVTNTGFVGLFGYEMRWPRTMYLGHISTFSTPGFQTWQQDAFQSADTGLQNYYTALASVSGAIGQFNHPGNTYGTFSNFTHHSAAADRVMTLLEVGCGEGVPGNDGYASTYKYYIQALDAGWHVAPTNNQANHRKQWGDANSCRTVVYAQALTEEDLYDALRSCRVYATEDSDLEILFHLDGHFMGSRLKARHIGQAADISVSLNDPSDSAIGLVEVIGDGGTAIASQTVPDSSETLQFSLSPEYSYYFLKITQPDGQTAVTAPVWVEHGEALGITGLRCETAVTVQNQPVSLTLSLYNEESVDFVVEQLQLLADGVPLCTDSSLTSLPAGSAFSHSLTFSCGSIGQTRIQVILSGTLEGAPRTYEAELQIRFRRSEQVTSITVDGSHGNAGLDALSLLEAMAAEEDIEITILQEEATAQMLESCRFLLIPPPTLPFSQSFLSAVSEFAAYGGSVVVCGQAGNTDAGLSSTAELNRLLIAVGASLRLLPNEAVDPINNGGRENLLFSSGINTGADCCADVSRNQIYRQDRGCTVDPGSGIWLVQGSQTTSAEGLSAPVTLLAWESLSAGGAVFAAGDLFLEDAALTEPKNIWDEPYANRTIAEKLLGLGGEQLPLSTIRQAATGTEGTLFRIRGYVTAGTSNPHTTFPGMLYLQDDTGGIGITAFSTDGIQTGTPVEITGSRENQHGNPVLKYISHEILDTPAYQYQGLTGPWSSLLDPSLCGSRLVEVEGECTSRQLSQDGTLQRFTLKDSSGSSAEILIEDSIRSHATGENSLHKTVLVGRTIRASGLLYVDPQGNTVIRVRNCEEVMYVPPLTYRNPNTGDPLGAAPLFLCLSSAGLLLLHRKRRY